MVQSEELCFPFWKTGAVINWIRGIHESNCCRCAAGCCALLVPRATQDSNPVNLFRDLEVQGLVLYVRKNDDKLVSFPLYASSWWARTVKFHEQRLGLVLFWRVLVDVIS